MRNALLNKVKLDDAEETIGPEIECIKQVKEGEIGTYMIGGKKTFAKLSNGNLLIKVGGGWVTLDQYIKDYLSKQTAMLWHKGVENKEVLAWDQKSKTQKRHTLNATGTPSKKPL